MDSSRVCICGGIFEFNTFWLSTPCKNFLTEANLVFLYSMPLCSLVSICFKIELSQKITQILKKIACLDKPTSTYQYLNGIMILINRWLFNTIIDGNQWYHAFACIPDQHWLQPMPLSSKHGTCFSAEIRKENALSPWTFIVFQTTTSF